MKRDQHGPKAKGDNITWADVTALLRDLQAELAMRVDIHIYTESQQAGGEYTRVEVRAFSWVDAWDKPKHKVSGLWETRSVATMTGMIVRLLHQLDHVVWHARRAEAEVQGINPPAAHSR